MVPLIKKKFGKNLLAIAARGSFARKTDASFSDLELFAFLKEMPRGQKKIPYGKMQVLKDGLSIEMLWITPAVYIQEVREVTASWYGVGSEKLLPVYGKSVVEKIAKHKPTNKKQKCLDEAHNLWPAIYFTGETALACAQKKDHEKIALAVYHFYMNIFPFLAFINSTPYTTGSRKILEAKKFKKKLKGFSALTRIIVNGQFRKYKDIQTHVEGIMDDAKKYLREAGYDVPDSIPAKKRPDVFGMRDKETRYEQAVETWHKVQESSTKVLNAAEQKNAEAMAVVINDMFFQYLKILSCLNAKTLRFSQIITDAKKIKYQPVGFPKLIAIVENGEYKSFSKIKKTVIDIFSELENRIEGMGYVLYQENADPNKNELKLS